MRKLSLTLAPAALLIVVALTTHWYAWTMNRGIEYRKANHQAVEQRAKKIDHAAGILPETSNSATALARILKSGNDAEADYVEFLQSLGFLMFVIAVQQIVVVVWLHRRQLPSNH